MQRSLASEVSRQGKIKKFKKKGGTSKHPQSFCSKGQRNRCQPDPHPPHPHNLCSVFLPGLQQGCICSWGALPAKMKEAEVCFSKETLTMALLSRSPFPAFPMVAPESTGILRKQGNCPMFELLTDYPELSLLRYPNCPR